MFWRPVTPSFKVPPGFTCLHRALSTPASGPAPPPGDFPTGALCLSHLLKNNGGFATSSRPLPCCVRRSLGSRGVRGAQGISGIRGARGGLENSVQEDTVVRAVSSHRSIPSPPVFADRRLQTCTYRKKQARCKASMPFLARAPSSLSVWGHSPEASPARS